jgi:hypothetical protein
MAESRRYPRYGTGTRSPVMISMFGIPHWIVLESVEQDFLHDNSLVVFLVMRTIDERELMGLSVACETIKGSRTRSSSPQRSPKGGPC